MGAGKRGGSRNSIAGAFLVLIILMSVLMMANGLRRTSHITLPPPSASAAQSGSGEQEPSDAVIRVEVTPQTVQAAVKTLHRPDSYIRTLSVEWLWSGGSGEVRTTVTVHQNLTRADTVEIDRHVRHMITDGRKTYIWYDNDRNYYAGAAGGISADQEQSIPTYEDILELDANQITAADYRTFSGEDCIYVETGEDQYGYALRYWVSVKSGLLAGAEKLHNGEIIFRMTAQPLSDEQPAPENFVLPDGKSLWNGD